VVGRSPGSRINKLEQPSRISSGLLRSNSPRSQWRGRAGFSPASQLHQPSSVIRQAKPQVKEGILSRLAGVSAAGARRRNPEAQPRDLSGSHRPRKTASVAGRTFYDRSLCCRAQRHPRHAGSRREIRNGYVALCPSGMVRCDGRVRSLAQPRRIPFDADAASLHSRHCRDSSYLVVAKVGFHKPCSALGIHLRIFPDPCWGEGEILGSHLSILGGFGLPVGLSNSGAGGGLAHRPPRAVGMRDPVVVNGLSHIRVTFDVSRRAGKRLHFHLTPA
jgi:hypothetical protein